MINKNTLPVPLILPDVCRILFVRISSSSSSQPTPPNTTIKKYGKNETLMYPIHIKVYKCISKTMICFNLIKIIANHAGELHLSPIIW